MPSKVKFKLYKLAYERPKANKKIHNMKKNFKEVYDFINSSNKKK